MRKRVLIADDNVDAADTTAMLLEGDERFEVMAVYGGRQAVDAATTFVPDLVMLDINMPVMDGHEAARILRSAQPPGRRLVLVALTGRTTQDDVDRARLSGFDHHLAKPAQATTFCALIASFLDDPGESLPTELPPRRASPCGESGP